MKRKSIYQRFIPAVAPEKETHGPAYWFIFNDHNLLINPTSNNKLPFTLNLNEFISPVRTQYLGMLEGYPCYVGEVAPETSAPYGMAFQDLKSLYDVLDEDIFLLAGRAIQIMNWDKSHQFCGKCGTPTETMSHKMAKKCPVCGFMSFTRLSPAVITAIIKEGKILMAKHSYGHKNNRYSLIAGFVEPGETLEEGLQREVREEVGVKVKNIKYFGSQPWPFPHSLMVGFTAEYKSGKIQVDGDEILEAKWFAADEVTPPPSKMSISSELIDWFIRNY